MPETPQQNDSNTHTPDGFFYRPVVIRWILRIFYVLCAVVVILDLVVHRHIETPIEKIPAFYPIYGFIACVVLVLLATQMRKLLMRSHDYYSQTASSQSPSSVKKSTNSNAEDRPS